MAEPGTTQNTFNIERLHEYGRRLAHSQSFGMMQRAGHPLRTMLEESREVLLASYHSLAKASLRQEEITPGAQWLLDNFYLIKDQMREVRQQLPRKYYLELPKLNSGVFKGLPRVYEIMHELADLVDNAVNQQNVQAYMEGYQEVDLLRLGELWAIPSMLRIVLLQNLHTTALQLRNTQRERQRAYDWAQRILKAASDDPVDGLLLVREMTDRDAKFTDVFVISLAKHLQGQGPTTAPVLDWIERRLQARHVTLAEIVHIETQRQTQRQVSIANAITTLRWATETDWKAFVESLSGVERTLRQDPAGVYPKMDFRTRDLYRHRVEDMAKYASLTEFDVAEHALSLALAAEACTDDEDPAIHCQAPRHVGTYLIGEAAPALKEEIGYQPPLTHRLRQFSYRHPTFVFLASILTLTTLTEWATLAYASSQGATPLILVLIAACAFLPFLDFAVALTNRLVAQVMPPKRLPKLDFEQGIPAAHRSIVVIPTLITSPKNARQQAEHLEIHALANPHAGLRFALLTDFPDAPEATMPGDAATLEAARKAIAALNERYRDAWGDAFFLLHRERRWNEAQSVWMGWERKRGKLEEFNTLLREPAAETSYTTIEGDFFEVTKDNAIRYVITLDADTRLPPGSAVDLVRTAAHPLNEPYYDPHYKRITKGYGILQPRVSISLEGSTQSAFARIYSGNVGLDLYTTAVSDVYQDLFGEGIFTGKGLYDVDAFRATLEGTIPTNTVLSHDLLEGNYARAALVSDIEVFDDYPSSYIPFSRRLHRWIRGDWQILSWLFPVVRDTRGRWRRNPISTAGKWKILDNLRRSLTGPALLLLLLLGWIVLPTSPFLWTGIVLAVLAFPIYINLTTAFLTRPHDVTFTSYFQSTLAELKIISLQTGLTTALLAHQSVVTLDAIFRTLWRMFVSKKHLLDWVTAHQAELSSDGSLRSYVRYMWTSIAWGGLIFMLTSILDPRIWFVALPFAVLWIVAPWIAYRVSKPTEPTTYVLTGKDTVTLRTLARRTWRYFDRFVNGENRWLPPDNFQEEPYRGLARRTSPTNMGLALLATQAAYDLGYLPRADLIHRLAESLGSIRLLDRHAGHFYNWYSTDTGEVMYPHYVSTVDSGNMAASLIALRQALYETPAAPWPNPAFFDGLRDTLAAFKEDLASLSSDQQTGLASSVKMLEGALPLESPATLAAWKAVLDTLTASAQAFPTIEEEQAEGASWQAQLVSALEKQRDALTTFAPWLGTEQAVPEQAVPEPLQTPTSLRALQSQMRRLRKDDTHAALHPMLAEADAAITDLFDRTAQLITWCDDLVESMDFSLLYDTGRGLFTIGYNVDTLNADTGMYDLLASEARLASYVAIGKGDVPVEHWFRLSRPLASLQDRKALLSWSGTMFEYLMPLLLMRSYANTLLDETSTNVVRWQIQYGRRKSLPWGISESAYNALNLELDYQYRAFGVPGLGLKRGLSEDYVVAPYATVLALLIDPEAALDNLKTLRDEQAYGPMGFYDAIDYTKARLFTGQDHAVVRTYMAHHQGMILLAAQNVLTNNLMRRRFHAAPNVRASELLLQERTARKIETIDPHPMETEVDPGEQPPTPSPVTYHGPDDLTDPTPYGHLLSNGSYTTFISNAGAGYSSFNKWAVTRWMPDRTTDDDGFFIYVRDLDKQTFWSVGHQPVQRKPDRYDVWFHLNKAEFARVDDWIETFMEVCVSPEDNMEVRRLTLTNYSDEPRRLEVTSYAEVVINEQAADQAHPAFSKLFVQTEYVPEHHALLATRRQRSEHDLPIWLVHTVADDNLDLQTGPLQLETDRARFIGRGRTLTNPAAMDSDTEFSGTTGSVLDPIVSLRRVIEIQPKERVRLTFSLGTATSRQEALRLADQYDNPPAIQRVVELATVYGNVETRYLDISGEQAMRFQQLASALLYGAPSLRAPEEALLRNRKQQPSLWAYGISGDLPVVVVHVEQMNDMDLARTMIKAHEYWKLKNLKVDVVFLNEHPPSYVQELQDALVQAVQTSHERGTGGQQGGFFVLRADQIPEEDLTLIHTVAAAVLESTLPSLLHDTGEAPPEEVLYADRRPVASASAEQKTEHLQFHNGYGGFSEDGSTYIIHTNISDTGHTPLPWINVLANEQMGCLATESGAGYTWTMNSRENRLTPWSNDPITDPVGEALYIRDEDSGQYWSPTPHPAGDDAPYETEHGFGYTTYRHQSQRLDQETTVFVTRHDPVKIVRLRLTNRSERERTLSVFRYQEWVLGVLRAASARYVATSRDANTGAVFAQNWYNQEFAGRVAFASAIGASAEDNGFTT
ncbi:MAG TPA: glucoamylase family protein, partial [Rhodothermales bacterium]|nr:glucoamylase family protein [Rhodothermales bacterium]